MSPDVAKQITEQERFFEPLITEPEGVDLSREELDGVPVEWTEPAGGPSDPSRVLLYLHGGGYSGGLAAWARRGTARLALGLGCRVGSSVRCPSRAWPIRAASSAICDWKPFAKARSVPTAPNAGRKRRRHS